MLFQFGGIYLERKMKAGRPFRTIPLCGYIFIPRLYSILSMSIPIPSYMPRRSTPFVEFEGEGEGIVLPAGERFGRHRPPVGFVPCGKHRIALVSAENARQVESPGQRQGLGIDLGTPDHEHLFVLRKQPHGLLQRMHDPAAGNFELPAGDDDIGAVGQRPPERLERLAAHDDRMARRHGFEMLQVFGNVPQQGIFVSDNAVFGNGNDD